MMILTRSPLFYLIVGALWIIVAVLQAIENPLYVGPVFWPSIIYGVVGVAFCVYALILALKIRRQNEKAKQELENRGYKSIR